MFTKNVAELVAENNEFVHVCLRNTVLFFSFLDCQDIIESKCAGQERLVELFVEVVRVICALDTFNSLDKFFVGDQVVIFEFLWDNFEAVISSSLFSSWLLRALGTFS